MRFLTVLQTVQRPERLQAKGVRLPRVRRTGRCLGVKPLPGTRMTTIERGYTAPACYMPWSGRGCRAARRYGLPSALTWASWASASEPIGPAPGSQFGPRSRVTAPPPATTLRNHSCQSAVG